jgi:hypothetical protein
MLSDERLGLSFTIAAAPRQSSHSQVPSPAGLMTTFYFLRFEAPTTWRARSPYLYPPGTVWPSYIPKHWVPFLSLGTPRRATVEVSDPSSTRDSNDLNYQSSLHSLGAKCTENVSSIIEYSLVAGEATCPQSCSVTMAVVLSLIYIVVTWQWVYMSKYLAKL